MKFLITRELFVNGLFKDFDFIHTRQKASGSGAGRSRRPVITRKNVWTDEDYTRMTLRYPKYLEERVLKIAAETNRTRTEVIVFFMSIGMDYILTNEGTVTIPATI